MQLRSKSVLSWLAAYTALAAYATLGVSTPASGMPSAQSRPGLEVGGEVGVNFQSGLQFAGAGDLNYGFRTNLFGQPYTTAIVDILSVAERQDLGPLLGKITNRDNLLTVGIRQVVPFSGGVPIAVEGGLSYIDSSISGNVGSANTTYNGGHNTSGFVGARATLLQQDRVSITGMGRYHFQDGGLYQIGGGISGPIGRQGPIFYQADYYHLGGSAVFSSDTVLVGLRYIP